MTFRRSIYTFLFLLLNSVFVSQSVQEKLYTIDKIKNDSIALDLLEGISAKKHEPLLQLRINQKIIIRANALLKYSQAITLGNESVELAVINKLDSMEAMFNKLLGVSNYFMDRKLVAVHYFEKAIKIAEKNKFWFLEASCYNNIGGAYADVQQYAKAEPYLIKAITILKEHGLENTSGLLSYRVLARVYSESNQESKAEALYKTLIEKCKQAGDTALLCDNLLFYSEILGRNGETEKAISMSGEALKFMRSRNDLHGLQAGLAIHLGNLKEAGRYKEALELSEESTLLMRRIFAKDIDRQISEVEVKYKTIAIKREKEIAEIKARKEKQIYLFSIGTGILLTIIGFVFWNQKKNAKQRLVLQRQKLETLIEGEEKERIRIAKDLHDGIVQDLTAIKIKHTESNFSTGLDSDVDKVINEVRGMAYQMMPITLKKYGLIPAINDLLQKMLVPKNIKFSLEAADGDSEGTDFEERLPEKIEICLYRVVQEALNNVIKHSEASNVFVNISKYKGNLNLMIEDNGKGFDEEIIQKGLGMNSLASRVEILNGTISFNSHKGEGTILMVSLPLLSHKVH